MKIGLRGGHSSNCKGAIGLRDEYVQMQELYKYVKNILEQNGHNIIDCNSDGYNAINELSEGVEKSNYNNCDLYLTLHMNASDGNGHGTEAWIYSENSKSKLIAERLVNNYSKLGLANRGVKYSTGLYDLKNSVAGAIIFETCFCDSETDINIWSPTSWDTLARYICNAIDPNIPLEEHKTHGYIETGYLATAYDGYDGCEVAGAIRKYFHDVDRVFVRKDNNGVWLETQLLTVDKCNELKNKIGAWATIKY